MILWRDAMGKDDTWKSWGDSLGGGGWSVTLGYTLSSLTLAVRGLGPKQLGLPGLHGL